VPASLNSFLQTLSNWRILFAALAVILIGASDTARHLWATFLRNVERDATGHDRMPLIVERRIRAQISERSTLYIEA